MSNTPQNLLCKCGTGKNYLQCCGKYIDNLELPQNPQQLMQSRYTAYAMCNIEYIAKTMCGRASQGFNIQDTLLWAKQILWLKLEVLDSRIEEPNKGFVEFRAYFSQNNKNYVLHEISEFHRKNNKWFYVDGIILD